MLNVLRDRKADLIKGDVRVRESNSAKDNEDEEKGREAGRGGNNKRQVFFM